MMRRYLSIYAAQIQRAFAIWLQYRAAAVIWMISFVVQPLMYLIVWTTVAESSGGSVGGYTPTDFAAYFITLMVVDQLTYTWVYYEFDWRVREGEISRQLLLPVHPIHEDVADNLTYKLLMMVVLVPAVLVMSWAFRPNFDTTLVNLLLFLPALVLAFLMRFFLGWLMGLTAFWTTRITALIRLYHVSMLFFSGRLTPLSLLPPLLFTIARVLPFMWSLSFPVELLLGRLTAPEIVQGFAMQAGWVVGMFVLLRLLWRRAVRRYTAFGS